MTPKRPYLLRAMHEWLSDNELTPYLMVDTKHPDIVAPIEYAQDNVLVLNVGYAATKGLLIDNDYVSFSARFGGLAQEVWLPMACVQGIYAKEDHTHGLFFDPAEYVGVERTKPQTTPQNNTSKTASPFKIIK